MTGDELLKSRVEITPHIYAYIHPTLKEHDGWIKIGYTTRDVTERVKEQHGTANVPYKIIGQWTAMRHDGTTLTDKEVHRLLRSAGFRNPEGEWFCCTLDDVEHAVHSAQMGANNILQRIATFAMRDEQARAVALTANYLETFAADDGNHGLIPHFLWNAKMRFGKTFTTYQLAKRMGWTRLLVLTFKPAVRNAWRDDLLTHVDFEGWQFCEKQEAIGQPREFNKIDESKPFVCFASFQDVLGKNDIGGIKATNEWLPTVDWDCIVIDEYHYGAWGKRAKDFYDKKDTLLLERAAEVTELMDEDANDYEMKSRELFDEGLMPLTTHAYLYLSGTPFRAIANGEFIEEQIFNWTYADEQRAKSQWIGDNNPYAALPQMVMMTYQMPKSISEVADQGEFDEFDLNEFFRAKDNRFVHEEHVQKWLDLIRGAYREQTVSALKQGTDRPPMPFSDTRLQGFLQHTYWFLPSVASCHAMATLLSEQQNIFFSKYKVIIAAGNEAGIGAAALQPVLDAMDNPQETLTITLSCGKLSTGVTVRPWSGILMLRNTTSPETYFQTAFRVQSPWTTRDEEGREVVLKPCCYLFDFAPNRALRLVQEYSCQLNVQESNPERKVEEFIQFLPILAYDGATMHSIDAAEVMDMALSGTTATLLARRWESAVLVNVDNSTLQRLMSNKEAMTALMNIEGFRTLNKDIETIINKSEKVKNAKTKADNDSKTKREISEAEKEMKSMRKQIQEKLLKFATRIPAFMYLSDYREYCLKDVIRQLEPELFYKVTGLNISDFDLLVSLGVFNGELMNDAVYKFKRYEDSSLTYTGLDHSDHSHIGLYDTVIKGEQ